MEKPDAWRMTDQVPHELGKGDPFAAAIRATRMPMIITDPRQDDNPIVFVNDAFLKLSGYERDEIMGRNCRFLQGEETDKAAVGRIRDAIANDRDINVELLNYRKDGTPFWNALYVSPVFASNGERQFFFASQLDVTEHKELLAAKTALLHEVDHRVKNNLQMVTALIIMQVKTIADPAARQSLLTMAGRIEALSTVHRRLYQSDDVTQFSVPDFIQDIVTELVGAMSAGGIELQFDLDPVSVSAEKASPIALMINELVTNALKHGFPSGRHGKLLISLKHSGEHCRIEVRDDGEGMAAEPSGSAGSSFGQKLIQLLARQLSAQVTWSAAEPNGTRATIDMPIGPVSAGA